MQEFFHQNHTTRTDTSDTEEVPATISCTCRQGPAQLSKALVSSVSFSMNMTTAGMSMIRFYDVQNMFLEEQWLFSRGEFLMFLCAGKSRVSRLQWRQHPSAEKQISIWGHGPEVLDPSIGFVFSGFSVSKLMQLATKTHSLMIEWYRMYTYRIWYGVFACCS